VLKILKPSTLLPSYTSVWLPDVMRLDDNVQPAGQTAGFLGKRWEPERVICDPSAPNFQIQGLALPPEVPPLRLSERRSLLSQVEEQFASIERGGVLKDYNRLVGDAFGVLTSGRAREAFDLGKEPRKVRERYGMYKWGQCTLLARRLIEAGARLVHVNWPREGGDEAVNNPMWDTHAQNSDRLQDVLCPQMDITYTALLEDLEQRGLLKETLVVAIGEFGRTPKINAQGGRDHWGHVFSFTLAGAGISGGQVFGSSDKNGAYPATGKMEPQELTATMLHLLGVSHHAMFPHPTGRPIHATTGEPIASVLGDGPATKERTVAGGNLALVPGYDTSPLYNVGFEDDVPLASYGTGKRLKGWHGVPVYDTAKGQSLSSLIVADKLAHSGQKCALIGYGLTGPGQGKIAQGSMAMLTQQLRNPRAGHYTFTVHVAGGGSSAEHYRDVFLKNFTCKLLIFGYTELTKDATKKRREFGTLEFQPTFFDGKSGGYTRFELTRALRSQDAGAAEIEMGVGVAVVLVKTTPGELDLAGARAFLRIDDVSIGFVPRPRNDDKQV
jgi:hypothetical protein